MKTTLPIAIIVPLLLLSACSKEPESTATIPPIAMDKADSEFWESIKKLHGKCRYIFLEYESTGGGSYSSILGLDSTFMKKWGEKLKPKISDDCYNHLSNAISNLQQALDLQTDRPKSAQKWDAFAKEYDFCYSEIEYLILANATSIDGLPTIDHVKSRLQYFLAGKALAGESVERSDNEPGRVQIIDIAKLDGRRTSFSGHDTYEVQYAVTLLLKGGGINWVNGDYLKGGEQQKITRVALFQKTEKGWRCSALHNSEFAK